MLIKQYSAGMDDRWKADNRYDWKWDSLADDGGRWQQAYRYGTGTREGRPRVGCPTVHPTQPDPHRRSAVGAVLGAHRTKKRASNLLHCNTNCERAASKKRRSY